MLRRLAPLALAFAGGCTAVGTPPSDGAASPEEAPAAAIGYRRVDIMVATGAPGPEASQVRVVLNRAQRGIIPKTPEADDCLVVDDTTTVSVDGVALALERAGGLTHGQQISGVNLPGHCAPAQFNSPPGHVFEPRDRSRVVVSHEGWRAVVTIDDLTVPRRVTLEPDGPVRAGERVSMSWWPSHDRWEGYDASTGVRLWPSEGKPTHLEVPKLEADPPNFSFVVPELEPGDYRVDLALVYLRPEARVRSCRGARHCSASIGWREASPTMTVVE